MRTTTSRKRPDPVYYRGGVKLYHGDCRQVLCTGRRCAPKYVSLVCTDPPYGVAYNPMNASRARSGAAECYDFPPVIGDDEPFDPSHLLRYPRLVLFGANYYAHLLPPSPSWIVWDKVAGMESRRDVGFNDSADVEFIWTNLGGPARLVPHRWMGMMKASERRERRVHPTQKPVKLLELILDWRTQVGDVVLDPYAGSGSTLLACARTGRRAIGVEMSEAYCNVIIERLEAERS